MRWRISTLTSGMKRVKILGIFGIKSTLVSGTHQGRSSGSNSIVENSKSLEKMKKNRVINVTAKSSQCA